MCEHSIRRYEHCESYRRSPPRTASGRLIRFPPIDGETGRHRGASPVTIRTILRIGVMCGQSGCQQEACVLMPACGPRFALIPGSLTVAERRFGRYPAFMSAEMAVRRRRRDALLAPQEGSEYVEPLLRD